jgi:hypothetical protein
VKFQKGGLEKFLSEMEEIYEIEIDLREDKVKVDLNKLPDMKPAHMVLLNKFIEV